MIETHTPKRASRTPPPDGHAKAGIQLRTKAWRWNYDGVLPEGAYLTMMALCSTNGRATSLNAGQDDGIAAAFRVDEFA